MIEHVALGRRLRLVPTDSTTDLDTLLTRAGRGDRRAFAVLYEQMADQVYGLARRIVRDSVLAEDASQETFVDIWRLAPRFNPQRGAAKSWMLTIAHRRSVDRVRREEAYRHRQSLAGAQHANSEPDASHDTVILEEEHSDIAAEMSNLTELQREAVTLAFYEGRTHTEIATLLGLPLGTTKTRIRDGLIRLRDAMAGDA